MQTSASSPIHSEKINRHSGRGSHQDLLHLDLYALQQVSAWLVSGIGNQEGIVDMPVTVFFDHGVAFREELPGNERQIWGGMHRLN